jgi:hypothetical protein
MDIGPMSEIAVKWSERRGSANTQARRYMDFVIDGLTVSSMVKLDVISPFGWGATDELAEAAERLLGRKAPDLSHARTSLYVCPECGDLGCTAVSIVVEVGPETVVWKDFGYQNNYESDPQLEPLSDLGPFRFRRDSYERILEQARTGV